METLEFIKEEDVITNYYTGEKWFLVSINASQTYVNETRYLQLSGKDSRLIPKVT